MIEEKATLTRRRLLWLAGATTLAAAIPGCAGSDSAGDSGAGVVGNGTVDLAALSGASAPYSVVNFLNQVTVNPSGTFSTTVVQGAAMPLFLVGKDGKVAMAAISIPGRPLVINAESCLQYLLMATPGITATDPTAVTASLDRAKATAAYPQALNQLKILLGTHALKDAATDASFRAQLASVITSVHSTSGKAPGWQTNNSSGGGGEVISVDPPLDLFKVDANKSNPGAVSATLSNGSWRYISVDRVEKDKDGNVTHVTQPSTKLGINMMGGAKALSSALSELGSAGDPTIVKDPNVMNLSTPGSAQYWIQGFGLRKGDPLPAEVQTADYPPFVATIGYYVVGPLLSLIAGERIDADGVARAIVAFGSSKELISRIDAVRESTTVDQLQIALLDIVLLTANTLLTSGYLVRQGLVNAAKNKALGTVFKLVDTVLLVENTLICALVWSVYKSSEEVAIESEMGGATPEPSTFVALGLGGAAFWAAKKLTDRKRLSRPVA